MRELKPRDLVVELLRTLDLAQTDWDPRSGNGGVILMPSLYHRGSYQELERCLGEMRGDPKWRQAWWHVSARYLWGKECYKRVVYRKTTKGLVPILPPRSELLIQGAAERTVVGEHVSHVMYVKLYEWGADVNPTIVDVGVTRLVATMHDGDTRKIHLPRELLYLALGVEPGGSHAKGEQPGASDVQSPALAEA